MTSLTLAPFAGIPAFIERPHAQCLHGTCRSPLPDPIVRIGRRRIPPAQFLHVDAVAAGPIDAVLVVRNFRSMRGLDLARVVERVTHREEGRALGLEVAESDWPIQFMRWVTRVEPRDGGMRISQELEYELKFGPFGWLLDHLVMRNKSTTTLDGVFSSLVKHAEGTAERRE